MRTCVDLLEAPYQTRQGRLVDFIPVVLASGATAVLNFAQNSYVIGGRAFGNPDLVVTTKVEDYTNGLDGARPAAGRLVADFLPGIYDLVVIDPYGGEVRQNVVVSTGQGYELTARTSQSYVQLVMVFPAGQLTLSELEDLIVPINVNADWSEDDPEAAAYIQNKPNFITQADLNTLLQTTINDTIQTEVDEQIQPVIESANAAAQNAQDAVNAIGDVRTYHELGASYTKGQTAYSNENDQPYRALTDHDGVQLDPANDPTNWTPFMLALSGGTLTGGITEAVQTLGTSISTADGNMATLAMAGDMTFTDDFAAGDSLAVQWEGLDTYTATWPMMSWLSGSPPDAVASVRIVFTKYDTGLEGIWYEDQS